MGIPVSMVTDCRFLQVRILLVHCAGAVFDLTFLCRYAVLTSLRDKAPGIVNTCLNIGVSVFLDRVGSFAAYPISSITRQRAFFPDGLGYFAGRHCTPSCLGWIHWSCKGIRRDVPLIS